MLPALLMSLLAAAPAVPADTFLRQYSDTRGFSNGLPTQVWPTADGRWVLFLRSEANARVQSLFAFDVATGKTQQVLTAEALLQGGAQTLSVAERAQLERKRISARGFTGFEVSDDGKTLVTVLSGRIYLLDVAALTAGQPVATSTRPLSVEEVLSPKLSADGKQLGYVKDWDVHVLDVGTGQVRQLTSGGSERFSHGLAEFVAQEEMQRFDGFWWSPDGKHIAYEESDTRGVETFTIQDPARPEQPANTFPYPRPGKANARVRLGIVPTAGGPTTWVQWDEAHYPYLTRVVWPKKGPLTVLVENRAQTEELLLRVEPQSGATQVLLREKDSAWLNLPPAKQVPFWLPDGSGFFWLTERTGGWSVELHAPDGVLQATWVSAEDKLVSLLGYDGAERALYFLAAPQAPDTVVMRARAGARPERVFPKAGERTSEGLQLSDDGSVRVLTTPGPAGTLRSEVRDRAGKTLGVLPSVAAPPPFVPQVEYRQVGARGFWTTLVRPRRAVPGQKLPVLVNCYGGPHGNVVQANPRQYLFAQWQADQGFLVVGFDGRGTPRRGRDWERAIKDDFSGVILDDQVAALQALAQAVPEMDLTRVGISGWSFGGYLSALAVLKRPDVFHAAVSGAPVVDWLDYDTFYTERYLGIPPGADSVYARNGLLGEAPNLQRPLLVLHGTSDDNVYFFHSLKLVNALFRAGRQQFEFLPLSGFTHMVADPVVLERLHRLEVDFLKAHLVQPASPVAAPSPQPGKAQPAG
jgi:dipeptidyl-peptidase 4